jgi:hypothetical protein
MEIGSRRRAALIMSNGMSWGVPGTVIRRMTGRLPTTPSAALDWDSLRPPGLGFMNNSIFSLSESPSSKGNSWLNVAAVDAAQPPWANGKGPGTYPPELCPPSAIEPLDRVRLAYRTVTLASPS